MFANSSYYGYDPNRSFIPEETGLPVVKCGRFEIIFSVSPFSRLGNLFGNFDEPFVQVSKPFARSC